VFLALPRFFQAMIFDGQESGHSGRSLILGGFHLELGYIRQPIVA
jgi:hypothetical protein